MSGGWNYPDGAIHDEFCDIAVGSGREKEEVGVREGRYGKVNQH